MEHHCCHEPADTVSVDKKLKISALALGIFILLSFAPLSWLEPLNESLLSYLGLIWWAVALGLLLGGLIDHFVPGDFINRMLGGRSILSLFRAVLAGFLLSACSHGILAIAMQLYQKGARIAATMTFLLASPWANLPVTVLLFSFFGWQALLFVGAAMLVALVTGMIFLVLERMGLIEGSRELVLESSTEWSAINNFDFHESVQGVYRGTLQLANMVLWWIIIGVLAAAVIGAYVPHHIFMDYFGASFSGLSLTLLAATVIEVCSEGSSPIAFEIYNKVGVLGNPFVFLMAGVVTDYTEIGLIWSNIGRKAAIWMPLVTVPQVLLLGYLFNVGIAG